MLEINVKDLGEIQVLRIAGHLDSSSSADFEEAVLDQIDSGRTKLVFDFSALDYISSAGLRVLLVAVKRVKPSGSSVVLYGVNDTVKEIFDICGFTALFKFTKDQAGAIESFT